MSKSVQKGTFDRAGGRCYLSFMKNKSMLLSVLMIGSTAFAMPLRQDIKVGGHFNFAVPLVTYGNDTKTIGEEYTKVGLAPGVTFKLDDSWGFDLEFVAYNNFMNKPDNKGMTSLVVDPGRDLQLRLVHRRTAFGSRRGGHPELGHDPNRGEDHPPGPGQLAARGWTCRSSSVPTAPNSPSSRKSAWRSKVALIPGWRSPPAVASVSHARFKID